MPSLKAFGRRWNIASDDFVFPEITEGFVRLIWVAVTCGIFIYHNPFKCKSIAWFIYVIILIIINIITAILCFTLAGISAKGSILETEARKNVKTIIYLRLPLLLVECIWTIFSTGYVFQVFGEEDFCYFIYGMRATILLEWILIISVLFGVFVVFNPHGDRRIDHSVERSYWRKRLRLCKVRADQEMRIAIDDIAALMATFFVGHDFVLSDIVAGLLLVVHSPHTVTDEKYVMQTRPSMPFWMKLPENLATVSRFLDIATAVYGWPSYMFNNCGCLPWFRLFQRLQCCRTCRGEELVSIESDNCCSCHTSAFILESALEHTDLAFVSFRNKLYLTPFVVLTDHETRSIVVTIRGSASLMDLITDLSLNCERFSVDVDTDPILREDKALDDGEVRVHRGMLHAARYVYNTLKANKVLERLLMEYPDYQVVVCGHSLGAGIASLLTLLLKQTYPDIRCYSFSPPGCVVSKHGLQEMENHVLSVIVGDDLVPRISYQSMYRLKKKIDREVYSTSKAKYEILIKGIFKLFFSAPWELHDTSSTETDTRDCRLLIGESRNDRDRLSYGSETADPRPLEEHEVEEGNESAEVVTDSFRVQLFPPGRLAHFNVIEENIELRWIEPEFLSDIQLTGAIFADHFPYRMRKVIKKANDAHSLTLTTVVSSPP